MPKKKTDQMIEEKLDEALILDIHQSFNCPDNWSVIKFGSIANFTDYVANGSFKSLKENVQVFDEENYAFYIRLYDLRRGIGHKDQKYVDKKSFDFLSKSSLNGSEILLASVGSVGAVYTMPKLNMPATIAPNMIVCRVNKKINNKYIFYYLNSPNGQLELERISSGTTQQKINKTNLKTIHIPLPPLNEQQRIVEKIERLLGKIDEAKRLIEEAKETFELRRAAILEKAFNGSLYNDISIKPDMSNIPCVTESEYKAVIDSKIIGDLYEIPQNWKWVYLNDLIELSVYGTSAKTDDDEAGIPVLRMGNIVDGQLYFDNLKYLPKSHPDVEKLYLENNDIVFNRTNSYELVGKSALFKSKSNERVSFASYLIRVRLIEKNILAPYIAEYINSFIGRGFLMTMVTQQVGQANINSKKLSSLPVPLPPLAVVKRINEIIHHYRDNENQQNKILKLDYKLNSLKQSILSKSFKGELGTNDLSDEEAIELLKSILKEK